MKKSVFYFVRVPKLKIVYPVFFFFTKKVTLHQVLFYIHVTKSMLLKTVHIVWRFPALVKLLQISKYLSIFFYGLKFSQDHPISHPFLHRFLSIAFFTICVVIQHHFFAKSSTFFWVFQVVFSHTIFVLSLLLLICLGSFKHALFEFLL